MLVSGSVASGMRTGSSSLTATEPTPVLADKARDGGGGWWWWRMVVVAPLFWTLHLLLPELTDDGKDK